MAAVSIPLSQAFGGQESLLYRRRRFTNGVMLSLTGLATALALVPLVWIVFHVLKTGLPVLNLDFFTQLPAALGQRGGGVRHAIEGTIVVTLLGMVISIPMGVLAAFYTSRHANTPLGVAVRFGTDVLSGVPSIIVGLFGYALLVNPMNTYSALAGGVAVSIIMLPTIIRTTEEMLKLVPGSLREAGLGLGAPEWRTSLEVVLPAALTGVVTGVMLAIARGVGETAPLLFTILGNDRYSVINTIGSGLPAGQTVERLLVEPADSLTLTMFRYSQQPFPERVVQSWGVALVLMVFVLGLNVLARVVVSARQRRLGKL